MDEFEFHPAVMAADTTDIQASTATRIMEAAGKGTQAAAFSGALSIYNTFADYTGKDQVDIEDAIRKYDPEIGDYYADNKQAIDMVGFVATSMVPGSLGIKALQLARTGTALGNVGKFLNLTASKKSQYLRQALQETAENGGVVSNILSRNRIRQLAWESADQALLGTAFELAVVGTMNDSPIFDNATMGDFGWNVALGTVFSGAIGGPLGSLAAKGVLKSAQREIEAQMRLADTVLNPSQMGLTGGTEALILTESMLNLSDDFRTLRFNYREGGKAQSIDLNVTSALEGARTQATKQASDELAMKFNELAGGDERIGQAVYGMLNRGIKDGIDAGLRPSEITQALHGYLNQLDNVRALDLTRMELDARKFYVRTSPLTGTADEQFKNLFSLKRTKETTKQPYYIADDVLPEDINIGRMEELGVQNLREGFRKNPELDLIRKADGTIAVNPYSKRIKKLKENPVQYRQFVDLETGAMSSEAVPTFGDILRKNQLKFDDDYIRAGQQKFKQEASTALELGMSPLSTSARYAWTGQLTPAVIKRLIKDSIDTADLPMLTRLQELHSSGEIADSTMRQITFKEGATTRQFDDIVNFKQYVEERKINWLEEQLAGWTPDKGSVPNTKVLAAHVNSTTDWVEDVIARGFTPPRPNDPPVGKLLNTQEALSPRTVEFTWDFGVVKAMLPEDAYNMNMGPSHLATKELTKEYQYAIRERAAVNAFESALGQDAALFMEAADHLARDSSISGAGSTAFGASNAGYGERAKLWAQDTGKNVALVTQRKRDEAVLALTPYINALRDNPQASAELGILTTALRKSPMRFVFDDVDPKLLVSLEARSFARANNGSVEDAALLLQSQDEKKLPHMFRINEQPVADFLAASTAINKVRQSKLTTLYNATGLTRAPLDEAVVYIPPINTVKYPYHAFVRTKQQVGLATDVGMITAKSEEQLRKMVAEIGDDFDVFYKADTDAYYKIKGEYDYSLTLNESRVNSQLARSGALADFVPETRLENIMEDYLNWHAKSEEKLVRTAVQVRNRQFFSEMQFLSDQYRKVSESVTRGIGSRFKSKVADPFGDYIKTSLNISKQQEFPLLDSLNEFVDKVSLTAGEAMEKAFFDAKSGIIPWEEANKITKQYGLGTPYNTEALYLAANERMPRNIIREGLQKANMALATTVLRLDFANSLVNIISTPILLGTEMSSIRQLIKNDPQLTGKLAELTSLPVPGGKFRVPGTTQLIGKGINNYFGKDRAALLTRYRDIGAIKEVSQLYHEMLDDLSFRPTITPKKWIENVNAGVEKAAKLTGNVHAEELTRFLSADAMRQLTDPIVAAGKMTVKEQNAYISTFVNRVQGNYVTSQRPIIFQGTTGAAISLFQTYAFNVLQQLHRHIQAGDKKTLAIFAGLQGSVFGLNGLPFFDAVNTHLIGSMVAGNEAHNDAYSVLPAFNKELGDWMLYGTASAFPLFGGSAPALFSRGDINPRHLSIIPINPLDVPAVSASIKLVNSIWDTGKNIASGVDASDALLKGLEHQGLNRPLAGFAQLLAGQSTTSKGSLISAASDMETTGWLSTIADRMQNYGGVSRLAGARPMDEAVALSAIYRQKKYDALDRSRIERLGQVVKTKLQGNEAPTDEELEEFMLRYTRSGGRIENFNRAMQSWGRDANVSIVNQLTAKLGTPYAQKLRSIMGAEDLPDYQNQQVIPQAQEGLGELE